MKTQLLATRTSEERHAAIDAAVRMLRAGEVVALPTETVYGLAADAMNPGAVAKVFEAKGRPYFDPLIVHLPARQWLYRIAACEEVLVLVEELTSAFWPGPLTLVLPRSKLVPEIVTAGLETVAVRMSNHPMFREVSRVFGKPLAAPSANRFGRISPTTAGDVISELGDRIPLVIDDGPTEHGLESTIVAVEPGRLRLLRSGPIPIEELETIASVEVFGAGKKPEAPGQLKSHYAPRTPFRLLPREGGEFGPRLLPSGTGLLAFRQRLPQHGAAQVEILSATGDLREAAATLFSKLRRLDEAGLNVILAEPVPEIGLGVAIMDRLRKAAGEGTHG